MINDNNLTIQPASPAGRQFNNHKTRNSATGGFGQKPLSGFASLMQKMLIGVVLILMSLPLSTTFNEMLTKVAEKTGFYQYLSNNIVPFETKAVTLVLTPLGIKVRPSATHLYITNRNDRLTTIYLSWNCLGWQSALMLLITLFVGLSGNFSIISKIETIILGVSGTFLINLLRISVVTLVAYYFGQLPATIVHDYGGLLFTVIWFFWYWMFSYKYILEER